MITISLCMIVKNEEDMLERCLNSVKDIVDEIIVVDTGSTDKTKEIASKFTDKIFDFVWIDDFSAARNFSFEQASMEYIMWLDADDIILPEDSKKLIELKTSMPNDTDAVMMKYNTGFDWQGNVTFSYFRERLSKRVRGFKWKEPVHEYLEFGGKVLNSDICITHGKNHKSDNVKTDKEADENFQKEADKNSSKEEDTKASASKIGRNIRIYKNLLSEGKKLSPRGMYYYARELNDHKMHDEAIKWFNSFLDTSKGWVEDNIAACGEMAKCYLAIKNPEAALTAMLRSFQFDIPRAEICCQIGYYFKELQNYKLAVFWFEAALNLKKPENNWGFFHNDCWGFIPCMECVVCYDRLGDYEKAADYNEKASVYKPDSPAVLYNRLYFKSVLNIA